MVKLAEHKMQKFTYKTINRVETEEKKELLINYNKNKSYVSSNQKYFFN